MANLECWNCGASLDDLPRPITRHMNCPKCFVDLHCCRMCSKYAPNATITCNNERAEPPVNKENANFCDYYRPTNAFRRGSVERQDAAKARLDSLFGGDGGETEEGRDDGDPATGAEDDKAAQARRRLEDLFGQ